MAEDIRVPAFLCYHRTLERVKNCALNALQRFVIDHFSGDREIRMSMDWGCVVIEETA
jgi:hypothetical protein